MIITCSVGCLVAGTRGGETYLQATVLTRLMVNRLVPVPLLHSVPSHLYLVWNRAHNTTIISGHLYKVRTPFFLSLKSGHLTNQDTFPFGSMVYTTVCLYVGMVIGGSVKSVRSETGEEVKVDLDKETEGELERQQEAELIVSRIQWNLYSRHWNGPL